MDLPFSVLLSCKKLEPGDMLMPSVSNGIKCK